MGQGERGYPPKILKPGTREKFLTALAKGASYKLCCGYAGIAYQTLRRWIKIAESMEHLHEEQLEKHEDREYFDFYCEIKRIESYAAIKWLEKLDRASELHWQAAAWKLERRHPEDYGRYDKDKKEDVEDNSVKAARDEVKKLKADKHGRSTTAKD